MRDERRYVIEAMTAFLDGSGDRRTWDDFTSCSLRDAEFDRIRRCAADVDLPLDAQGVATLRDLLDQAELMGTDDPTAPRPWKMEAGMLVGLIAGALLWWATYLPGAGLFHNLHLFIVPAAMGAFIVAVRNSQKKVGVYDPRIVAQNRKGRV